MQRCHIHYVSKHASGMYGVIMDNDKLPFAVTLQPNDKFFAPGIYLMKKDFYHKGGYPTFEIEYPGHDRVLVHKGNHQDDSKLCVLVGNLITW
jgi:hypothetical protein